jgi:hypothetical protein
MRRAVAAMLVVLGGAAGLAADEPRIVGSWEVPRVPLSAGVGLGGLSDLAAAPGPGAARRFWTLTDRGPNGTARIDGEKVRTLLTPDFVPALALVRLDGAGGTAVVERTVPLARPDGAPLSGRPPGAEVLARDDDHRPVDPDPHGVDPEGLVPLADGTFWIAEEYRPALVHVDAAGRVLGRFVPRGAAATDVDHDVLPAIYATRRENRGFESLAASPDGRRLWALLQSPLDAAGRAAGKRTGTVRLLAFDIAAGASVAEHVYRLGDPAEPDYLPRGAPPDDGKLCAVAALDAATLLVLEQDDGGLARLYAADLAGATDTLAREPADDAVLERIGDLAAAKIAPVRKTLVADLTALRARMRDEVDGAAGAGGALKLEGLAVLDERHVALVNDDDFGVPQAAAGRPGRGCRVWIVELPAALPGVAAGPH